MSQSSLNPKEAKVKQSLRQHKDIKWSRDLTSYQIWTVMNSLLYEAAAPLCVYSNMSIETALSCLALSTNNRRRIAAANPDKLIVQLFYELSQRVEPCNSGPESKLDMLEYLINNGIERNIIVDHIAYSLQSDSLREVGIAKKKLKKHVAVYLKDYDTFKRDVVFRYYHLISTFANNNHYNKSKSGLKSTKDDMKHVYIISAMRAIDKFIPFKGTLTSYIQTWFQNAEGSSDFIVYDGEAFSLNRNVRKSVQDGDKEINNKAIPIHDREDSISDDEAVKEINIFPEFSRHIAKLPNAPLVFIAQNLPYSLSMDQKKRIEKSNKLMRLN